MMALAKVSLEKKKTVGGNNDQSVQNNSVYKLPLSFFVKGDICVFNQPQKSGLILAQH